MQIFRNLNEVQLDGPSVLTIGTFDGLHLGHQFLIQQLKAAAQQQQARSVVISFHPRPKTVLAPHLPGNDYLSTPDERIALFETLGLDVLILIPFTLTLAQTTARDFVQELVARLNIVEIWAGHDFALGKNREGNLQKLTELGQEFNYIVQQFEPFYKGGQIVSSTQVRQAISTGDIQKAAQLLGRNITMSSYIIHGDQRGRTIGFPTANFQVPPERLLPANGVYATFVTRQKTGEQLAGVTNIGIRPSFGGKTASVETYIFDFAEDIYGEILTLEFIARLRAEQKFAGIEALVAQIKSDVDQGRMILANKQNVA